MRPVLVIPAGRVPDWHAAEAHVEAMSPARRDALVDDAACLLGQPSIDAEIAWQRLHDGLAELRTALRHGERPASPLHCTLRAVGDAKILFEPHPPGRPTFLFTLIRLLDRAGVLDPLGCVSLCEADQPTVDGGDLNGVS